MDFSKAARRTQFVRFIVALATGIFFLAACGGQTSAPTQDADTEAQPEQSAVPVSVTEASAPISGEEDALVILMADRIINLEPYRMVGVHPEQSIASHLWDSLTWLNDDLQIEPQLAVSWRLVNNFAWEFKLREGITFHNGEPFNAEAARFSIERAASMPDSLETFAQDVALEEVEVVDDYTLRITTGAPVANLPYYLAFVEILPPVYYSETNPDQLALAPVGSGPYRLVEWNPSNGVLLEALPDYWKGAAAWPRLLFKTVPLAEERLAALADKRASLVTDLPPTSMENWSVPDSRLEALASTQRMLIGIHIAAAEPLQDKRVRQALNYGVDVEQLTGDLLEGYGERYGSWVNPPADNVELAPWAYNPDMARELLLQAGYQDGITLTLSVPVNTYPRGVEVAQAIARQLHDIGVTIEVEPIDWSSFVQRLLSDNVPALFMLGLNSRGDGIEDVRNLSVDFAFNRTAWRNSTFEDLLERTMSTFNEGLRTQLLREAQAIAYDEAPWIWLWRQYDFYGVDQDLAWTPRRDGLVYLYAPLAPPADTEE